MVQVTGLSIDPHLPIDDIKLQLSVVRVGHFAQECWRHRMGYLRVVAGLLLEGIHRVIGVRAMHRLLPKAALEFTQILPMDALLFSLRIIYRRRVFLPHILEATLRKLSFPPLKHILHMLDVGIPLLRCLMPR